MNVIRKAAKFINKLNTRQRILLFGGILLFTILILILFVVGSSEPRVMEEGSVDQGLGNAVGANIEINDDTEKDTSNEMYVHRILNMDNSYLVQEFVVKIGKGLWTSDSSGDSYYVWKKKPEDNLYLIDYTRALERVFFRFEQPVSLDQISEGGTLTNDQMLVYLERFVNNYFNVNYDYMNVKVFKDGKNFRIEANRDIHGLPLELSGFHEYSDYITITPQGELVEGQVILLEYEENGSLVGIMDPTLVGTVVNDYEFPKEYNQRFPLDFSYPESTLGDVPSGAPHAPYLDERFRIPSVESCQVRDMELVYFFSNNNAEDLTPAYKLNCWGEISLQGELYDVQNIIYTNAVDPDYVRVD